VNGAKKNEKFFFGFVFLIGAFFIAFIYPETAIWGVGLGILCVLGAFPKTDRRFKTGYKNNEGFNGQAFAFGLSLTAISSLGFLYGQYGHKIQGSHTQSSPISQSVQTQSRQQTVTAQDSAVRTQSRQQTVTA